MRKYFLSIVAAILAVGVSAFTVIEKKNADRIDGLYWYHPITGLPYPNNPQVDPPPNCPALGSNCALGFTSSQTDPVGNAANASQTRSESSPVH